MQEYKIFPEGGIWVVYSGFTEKHTYNFIKSAAHYSNSSITECYSWVKAKQENLLG